MASRVRDKGYYYVPEDRDVRARRIARELDERMGIRGKRVLDIGCHRGEITKIVAEEYDCEVVGIDIESHETWDDLQTNARIKLYVADIAEPRPELAAEWLARVY